MAVAMVRQNVPVRCLVHQNLYDPVNNSVKNDLQISYNDNNNNNKLIYVITLGCTRYVSTHSTFNGTVSTVKL